MSISEIKRLREERKQYIEKYTKELEAVKTDDRFSESYRQEKIKSISENLANIRASYDQQIKELIRQGKYEAMNKLHRAELDGLDEKELLKKMVIDNRNFQIEQRLVEQYKDDIDTLMEMAQKEVNARSPHAPAYLNALDRLNKNVFLKPQLEALKQDYRLNTMSSLQKRYHEELQAYEQQEQEFRQETEREHFAAALGLTS